MTRITPRIAAISLLVLAACGNADDITENREIAEQLLSQVTGDAVAPTSQVTQASIDQVRASTDEPVIFLAIESRNTSSLMVSIENNNGVQTYGNGARQSVALENGVLRASRGLTDDLMSSSAEPLMRAIATGQATAGPRELVYLNAASESYRVTLNCTYSEGPVITETCTQPNGTRAFANTYQRGPGGKVTASRQWLSQNLGYILIQQIQ